jgi:hypothetical protein
MPTAPQREPVADRPRLLIVPAFTELEWATRPRLEEWAEVASFDLPGVGDEPLPDGDPESFSRELVVQRGLEELDQRGWERFFVVADGEGIAAAVRVADARKRDVQGLALGHAKLSFRREGDRAPVNGEVWSAMAQMVKQDHVSFLHHAIPQVTHGSVDEDHAQRIVERFPKELIEIGWEIMGRDDVPVGDLLEGFDCPMLFAKHEGCLISTDEGFEDAAAAYPRARILTVPEAPAVSDEFADALRTFCQEVASDQL